MGQGLFTDQGQNAGAIAGGFFAAAPPPDTPAQRAAPASPGTSQKPPALCRTALARAGAGHRLPPGLLDAMAAVESGRPDPEGGKPVPWPWTIDADGTGHFYPSEQAAERAAREFLAAGTTSLDVGCLQVNLAQHPDAFPSLSAAFDPAANAEYAASFLVSLKQKFGDWPQAVAAYHSQTPVLGQPYSRRVYAAWQGDSAPAGFAATLPQDPLAAPAPMPPALPATALQFTSLMPAAIPIQPGPVTGRTLASYRANPVALAAAPQG